MGFLSDLIFGKPSQASSSVPAWQQQYLQDLYSGASSKYNAGNFGQIAGFDPLQSQGQNMALQYAQSPQFGGLIGNTQGALNQYLSGQVNLDAYNPIANQITQRFGQAFNESVIPGIRRGSLLGAGRPTSRANIATTQAADRFGQGLGESLSSLYLPAYQQAQSNIGTGLGLAGQVGSLGLLPSQIYQDIGGQRQQLQQQSYDSPYTALSRYGSLLGQPIINQSETGGRGGIADLFGFNIGL